MAKATPALQLTLDDDDLVNRLALAEIFQRGLKWVDTHFREAPWITLGEERLLFWSDVKAYLRALRCSGDQE